MAKIKNPPVVNPLETIEKMREERKVQIQAGIELLEKQIETDSKAYEAMTTEIGEKESELKILKDQALDLKNKVNPIKMEINRLKAEIQAMEGKPVNTSAPRSPRGVMPDWLKNMPREFTSEEAKTASGMDAKDIATFLYNAKQKGWVSQPFEDEKPVRGRWIKPE